MANTKTKYKPSIAVDMYELARSGMTEMAICDVLEISLETLHRWKNKYQSCRYALEQGRKVYAEAKETNYYGFIAGRLPEDLKLLWEELTEADDDPNTIRRLEKLINSHGRKARQRLLLHALIKFDFHLGKACRFVNINRGTYESWKRSDPDFHALVREITDLKKDFVESKLMSLIKAGVPAAVIHANKTLNADRGYSTKVEVTHTGTITHAHNIIPVSSLDLSVEIRMALLTAIRDAKANQAIPEPIEVKAIT